MLFSLAHDALSEKSKYSQTPSYMGMSYTDSHIQTLYSVTNVSTHAVPCFHLCSMPGIGTIFSGTQAVATTRALGKIAKKAKFVFGPPTSLMHSSPTPPHHPPAQPPNAIMLPSGCPKNPTSITHPELSFLEVPSNPKLSLHFPATKIPIPEDFSEV